MSTLAEIEQQKRTLLSEFGGWSPARLAYSPGPGSWSASEVIDHLVKTESEILKQRRTA